MPFPFAGVGLRSLEFHRRITIYAELQRKSRVGIHSIPCEGWGAFGPQLYVIPSWRLTTFKRMSKETPERVTGFKPFETQNNSLFEVNIQPQGQGGSGALGAHPQVPMVKAEKNSIKFIVVLTFRVLQVILQVREHRLISLKGQIEQLRELQTTLVGTLSETVRERMITTRLSVSWVCPRLKSNHCGLQTQPTFVTQWICGSKPVFQNLFIFSDRVGRQRPIKFLESEVIRFTIFSRTPIILATIYAARSPAPLASNQHNPGICSP
ncbi:hypothetical protein C8R45DRAFT_1069996 [Mycena sanguinolenta]|nr:hypothetical protein C8R45DRAFT_1069996 [Mycena sanguinolenta]